MAGPTPAAWMHGTIGMLMCAKVGVIAAHLELDVEIFARPAAGEKFAPGAGLQEPRTSEAPIARPRAQRESFYGLLF